jgi:hypothetical protein
VFVYLFNITPKAAVVKAISPVFVYLRFPLVSKLLKPCAYLSFKFPSGGYAASLVNLKPVGTLLSTSPLKGRTASL